MKYLAMVSLLALAGCATHPSNIKPLEVSTGSVDCNEVATRVNELSQKQEIAFAGDVVLVSLIGLPLMPSYEDELAQALGEWEQCK